MLISITSTSIWHLSIMNIEYINLVDYKVIFYIAVGFYALAIIIFAITKNILIYFLLSLVFTILLLVDFYLNDIAIFNILYVNGVSLVLLYFSVPLTVFVAIMFCKQSYLISMNLTLKQYDSISIFKKQKKLNEEFNQELEVDQEYIKILENTSLTQRIKNWFIFVFKYNQNKSILYNF